jgi:probable rRNA maturation factor
MDPYSRSPDGPTVGLDIAVVLAAPGWRAACPQVERLARRAAVAGAAMSGIRPRIEVLLADDRALRALNHRHRGKAKPTNVLSFPAAGGGGEIALALGVVRREARAAGRSVSAHLAHLVVHGTLHLAGHDHEAAGEARRMERAEARAMHRLGLPNPWRGVA